MCICVLRACQVLSVQFQTPGLESNVCPNGGVAPEVISGEIEVPTEVEEPELGYPIGTLQVGSYKVT